MALASPESVQGSRRIESGWRRKTWVRAAGTCFDGCTTSSFGAGKNAEKFSSFVTISPFSPHHSRVGPIFWPIFFPLAACFGRHHGPQQRRMRSGRPAGAVRRCPRKCRPGLKAWVHVVLGILEGLESATSWDHAGKTWIRICHFFPSFFFSLVAEFQLVFTLSHLIFDEFDICGLLKNALS